MTNLSVSLKKSLLSSSLPLPHASLLLSDDETVPTEERFFILHFAFDFSNGTSDAVPSRLPFTKMKVLSSSSSLERNSSHDDCCSLMSPTILDNELVRLMLCESMQVGDNDDVDPLPISLKVKPSVLTCVCKFL